MLREVEANWTDGRQVAGTNNWVMNGASNVPPEWIGTLQGDDPGFVDFVALDVRPAGTSPLVNAGASALSGPSGFAFPTPLGAPLYEAPERTIGLPGSALTRPDSNPIDIGAYEWSDGSAVGSGGSGTGGIAGSSASGAASGSAGVGGSAGSLASGGSATGGSGALGGSSAATAGTGGSAAGSSGLAADSGSGNEASCGCRTTSSKTNTALPVVLGFVFAIRRRRRR
jgi:MYXO-CTERM domain-containing protein